MKAKNTYITRFIRLILLILSFSLLTIIALSCYYTTRRSFQAFTMNTTDSSIHIASKQSCNIFRGNWVPRLKGPYYTNSTKCVIDDRQNCMKLGRPDIDFLKWRWKPNECDLPLFDANGFLELVRGKSMAFIGDSLGRNQLESLMCMLATVATSTNVPDQRDMTRRWLYKDYEFTVVLIWSPSLVKLSLGNPKISSVLGILNLYLDEVDEKWAAQIESFDYVIISSGHWFSRLLIYYETGKIIGCHGYKNDSIATLTRFYGYRMAIRTTFRTLLSLKNFKGMTLRISDRGIGRRAGIARVQDRIPNLENDEEMNLDSNIFEFYSTQMDEFREAKREGEKRELRFKLVDITRAMAMRPDDHPYKYDHPKESRERVADCLHWCLPGPIDLWNELLLHMLKMDENN